MEKKRLIVSLRSERLKSELARAGKTYRWLGDMTGVHCHYIGALMRHVRNPGPKLRYKIHRAMMGLSMMGWHEVFRENKR